MNRLFRTCFGISLQTLRPASENLRVFFLVNDVLQLKELQ